jgi:hypothetical protein
MRLKGQYCFLSLTIALKYLDFSGFVISLDDTTTDLVEPSLRKSDLCETASTSKHDRLDEVLVGSIHIQEQSVCFSLALRTQGHQSGLCERGQEVLPQRKNIPERREGDKMFAAER